MELDLDDPPEEADDVPEDDLEDDVGAIRPSPSSKAIDARRLIERRLELRRLQRHLADYDESLMNLDRLIGDDLSA